MRTMILAAALVLPMAAVPAAAEDDTRTAIELPADVRTQFLEHMRTHLNSLNDVVQLWPRAKSTKRARPRAKRWRSVRGRSLGAI